MKILTFIFSIYLLGLTFYPCQDTFYTVSQEQEQAVVSVDHHQTENHKSDDCSPLCVCSCCQTSVTRASFVFSPNPAIFYTDRVVGIVQNYISMPATPPFQPPQV